MRRHWFIPVLAWLLVAAPTSAALPRFDLYVIAMLPSDDQARRFTESSGGAGLDFSIPLQSPRPERLKPGASRRTQP